MIEALGPHAGFILACYAATALVIAGLIAWVLIDHRIQARTLAALESRGVRRRSARPAATASDDAETAP